MEQLPNKNRDYNENMKSSHVLHKEIEDMYTKPEDSEELKVRIQEIKQIPENIDTPKVLLKLGEPSGEDKFVHMIDKEGRDYVIALPVKKYGYHADIVNFARKIYKKEFDIKGGGWIHTEKGKITIDKTSQGYGEADKDFVKKILEKSFPDLEVTSTTVRKESIGQAQERDLEKYNAVIESLGSEISKHLYADVVHNKAVVLGMDMIQKPFDIEHASEKIAGMVYQSENGSSFGFDTLYIGRVMEDGTYGTYEIAQSRGSLFPKIEIREDGILDIQINMLEGQQSIEIQPENIDKIDTLNLMNEVDKGLLNMYKRLQPNMRAVDDNQFHYFE